MAALISEIREYVPMPGRLPDVVAFFHETVIPLFRKHDMTFTQMGFTSFGERSFGEFVYTLRFADLAELERKWAAFLSDPAWEPALAEREQDGPLYQSIRRRVVDSRQFDQLLG